MGNETIVRMSNQQIVDYISIMKEQGKSFDEINADLKSKGLTDEEITGALNASPANYSIAAGGSKSGGGSSTMMKGALWFVGGAAITLITYSSASNGGGHYFILYGPMIYGAITFFRGLTESAQD